MKYSSNTDLLIGSEVQKCISELFHIHMSPSQNTDWECFGKWELQLELNPHATYISRKGDGEHGKLITITREVLFLKRYWTKLLLMNLSGAASKSQGARQTNKPSNKHYLGQHQTKYIPYTKIRSVKTNIFVMKTAICAPNIPKMPICLSISIVRGNKQTPNKTN